MPHPCDMIMHKIVEVCEMFMSFLSKIYLPRFQTERLELRMLRLSDYKDLYETFREEEYLRYFGVKGVVTEKDAKLLLKEWISRLDPNNFMRWAIVLKESGKVIGTIGLHTFIAAYRKAAVGYDLNPAFQHHGYMQEALQMIMRYFFEDLGYHRLEAIVVTRNESSVRVVERAGFVREGLMRQWMYNSVYEEYYDAYIYALLDRDYTGGL